MEVGQALFVEDDHLALDDEAVGLEAFGFLGDRLVLRGPVYA